MLRSQDSDVYSHYAAGIHFQQNLKLALEAWEATRGDINDDKYRKVLHEAWELARRQGASLDADLGYRARNFFFMLEALRTGFAFTATDPVIPVIEIESYQYSALYLGTSLSPNIQVQGFSNLRWGASLKWLYGQGHGFQTSLVDTEDNNTSIYKETINRASLRIGAMADTALLDQLVSLSIVVSDIPLYPMRVTQVRQVEIFDVSIGAWTTLWKHPYFNTSAYIQSSRHFDKTPWAYRPKFGLQFDVLKSLSMALGLHELVPSYALKIRFPLLDVSFVSYSYRQNQLLSSPTWPRIYMLKLETEI